MELDYLVDTYMEKEDWHNGRLPNWAVKEHYKRQLTRNNVTFLTGAEDDIIGYLEIYWLDNQQLGKIINKKFFDVLAENLVHGDFVFVASAYIEPEHRNKGFIYDLNRKMKAKHKDRNYIGIIYEDAHNQGNFSFYKKGEI